MPRRGENIYKRKDGRWEARYIKQHSSDGKAIYGYLYAKSYREVKAKLLNRMNSYKESDEEAKQGNIQPYSFLAAAEGWMSSLTPHVKVSTLNRYRNLLELYINPKIGSQELDEITDTVIETHCRELLQHGKQDGTGLSPKTVSDVLAVIRSVMRFASQNGSDISCDGRGIRIKQSAKRLRVFSRAEQEQLCHCLLSQPDGCNMGILVCLFTGLRIGEICALKWSDISIPDQTIHVQRTMQRVQDSDGTSKTKIIISSPKSACSIRSIPVPDELFELILSYGADKSGYFLTNSEAKFIEPRSMQYRFKKILKESNIMDANFHVLRHTFATRCVEAGFDVKSLSEILGHSSVNLTMNRYVHPSMDLKKENMQRLSALFAVK